MKIFHVKSLAKFFGIEFDQFIEKIRQLGRKIITQFEKIKEKFLPKFVNFYNHIFGVKITSEIFRNDHIGAKLIQNPPSLPPENETDEHAEKIEITSNNEDETQLNDAEEIPPQIIEEISANNMDEIQPIETSELDKQNSEFIHDRKQDLRNELVDIIYNIKKELSEELGKKRVKMLPLDSVFEIIKDNLAKFSFSDKELKIIYNNLLESKYILSSDVLRVKELFRSSVIKINSSKSNDIQ